MDRPEQKIYIEGVLNFGRNMGVFRKEEGDYFLTEEARFTFNRLFPIAKEIIEAKEYVREFVEIIRNQTGTEMYQRLLDHFTAKPSIDSFVNLYFKGEKFEKMKKVGIDNDCMPAPVLALGLALIVRGLCIDKGYIVNNNGTWYAGPWCPSLN